MNLTKKQKIIIIVALLVFLAVLSTQKVIGQRLFFPAGFFEAVRDFFAGNPGLHATDYRNGTIILIKPIATGVGEGRMEAGDIAEIRDGEALVQRFGNKDFLGKSEKTNFLVVYYPGKLTEEQKTRLIASDYATSTDKTGKISQTMLKRRKEGIDYTKFLSSSEILTIRSGGLNKIPTIDLSSVIQKSPDQRSVVEIPKSLARIESFKNAVNKIVRKIIPSAYAGTGGTTTICSSGCNYTTLNAWETGEQGILTSPAIAQITGGFQDTTAVTIDGWTTSAANYIRIYTTASARHDGKRNVAKYRLEMSLSWQDGLLIYESYTRIEGLQIKRTGNNGDVGAVRVISAAVSVRLIDLLVYDSNGIGIWVTESNPTILNNVVVMNVTGDGIRTGGSGTVTIYAYNVVSVNNGGTGFYVQNWRNITCKNCYAGGNTGADYYKETTSTLNLTTSYSEDGSQSTPTAAWSTSSGGYFTNVTAGSEDIHIGSASTLKDAGTDLSGDSYWIHPGGSVDIDGQTRSGAWDIGADEYVPPPAIRIRGGSSGSVKIRGGPPAPAFVQVAADAATGSATTIALAQTSNPTTGNLIVVFVSGSAAANTSPTVADSLGNTYTEITAAKIVYGSYNVFTVFYKYNATGGGANTVTATFAGATTYRAIAIVEYSGLATATNPLDAAIGQLQVSPGTGTDVLTSTALTVAGSNELLIGYTVNLNGSFPSIAVSSGFTSRFNGHPSYVLHRVIEDKMPSPGSNVATFTLNSDGADSYITQAVAFKGAITGSGVKFR